MRPTGLPRDEDRTARLYADVHGIRAGEEGDLRRILSPSLLGEAPDFFHGLACLDAGCGGMAPAAWALAREGAARIAAVDLSEENLRHARRDGAADLAAVRFARGSLGALPFPAESFDFVNAGGVLHHLSSPDRGLIELLRVLRPGGTLTVGLYGRGGLVPLLLGLARLVATFVPYPVARALCVRLFRANPLAAGDVLDLMYVPYAWRYGERQALRWLEGNGVRNARRVAPDPGRAYHAPLARLLHASAFPRDSPLRRFLHGDGWLYLVGKKGS